MKREYVLENQKVICIVVEDQGVKISKYPYVIEPETRYTEKMIDYASGFFHKNKLKNSKEKIC